MTHEDMYRVAEALERIATALEGPARPPSVSVAAWELPVAVAQVIRERDALKERVKQLEAEAADE